MDAKLLSLFLVLTILAFTFTFSDAQRTKQVTKRPQRRIPSNLSGRSLFDGLVVNSEGIRGKPKRKAINFKSPGNLKFTISNGLLVVSDANKMGNLSKFGIGTGRKGMGKNRIRVGPKKANRVRARRL